MKAFTHREGKQANRTVQQEGMLLGECFAPNDINQYYKQPPAGNSQTHIAEQAVERRLFSQSVKNVSGPDNLSFGATRRFWKSDQDRIVSRTMAGVCTERDRAVFKAASGEVICKAGKDDYRELKANCPISLV